MLPVNKPKPQATTPLIKLLPDNDPTIDSPKMASMNNSAEPKNKITGRAIWTKKVNTNAPIKPPKREEVNAALSAREACPFFARANPSSTVA